jgi:hypothetical protein
LNNESVMNRGARGVSVKKNSLAPNLHCDHEIVYYQDYQATFQYAGEKAEVPLLSVTTFSSPDSDTEKPSCQPIRWTKST